MRRIGRIILMAAGLVMMCVILVISGFVETGVPPLGSLGMWTVCAGAVYYGAGEENS